MSFKIILVLVGTIFISPFQFVFADLVINEFMYDLSGSDSVNSKSREWIEVYNSGPSDVAIDASSWRIYDGSTNRTINGEVNFSIPALGYVIFAGDKDTFLLDHPSFSGVVYDTGITSLNNTGATLKILDQDLNTVDSVAFTSSQGGNGDGNSLQKISSLWGGAIPTPGIENENTPPPPGAGSSSSSSSSSSGFSTTSTTETNNQTTEGPKIKTKITIKTSAFATLPTVFTVSATEYSGGLLTLSYGKYFINFGDGDSMEIKASDINYLQNFFHTYFYEGEYVVTLEYYKNYYGDVPDAFDKATIRVVSMDIYISRVGDEKDFFVELTNNGSIDIDVSKWTLASADKNFTLPKNTFVPSKGRIIISSKVTNFSILDKNTLKLLNPQGETVFDYSASIVPNKTAMKPNTSKNSAVVETLKEDKTTSMPHEQISALNLGASVIESDAIRNNQSNSYLPMIVSIIFIGVGAGVVYFIRRRKVVREPGSDFDILDE